MEESRPTSGSQKPNEGRTGLGSAKPRPLELPPLASAVSEIVKSASASTILETPRPLGVAFTVRDGRGDLGNRGEEKGDPGGEARFIVAIAAAIGDMLRPGDLRRAAIASGECFRERELVRPATLLPGVCTCIVCCAGVCTCICRSRAAPPLRSDTIATCAGRLSGSCPSDVAISPSISFPIVTAWPSFIDFTKARTLA